jgi:DNA-binding CsgD family transcriptional regulator
VERRLHLSAMELCILVGLANGRQSKEIAALVGLSRPTVEQYVQRLRVRYNALSRTHLVACAFRYGTIKPDDIEDRLGRVAREGVGVATTSTSRKLERL